MSKLQTKKTQMMSGVLQIRFVEQSEYGVKIGALPYRLSSAKNAKGEPTERMEMVIILPQETEGLTAFEVHFYFIFFVLQMYTT